MRPSSSAPSSSLCRYQLTRQATLRSACTARLPLDHAKPLAGEALDLLTHRHDGGELVLLGDRHVCDHLQADVAEGSRRLVHLYRLRGILLNPEGQQLIGELRMTKFVAADEFQNLAEHRLARQFGVFGEMERRKGLAHHVARQKARTVLVPEPVVPPAYRPELIVLDRLVADAIEILVERVKMSVRLVQLDAEHRSGGDVVPQ